MHAGPMNTHHDEQGVTVSRRAALHGAAAAPALWMLARWSRRRGRAPAEDAEAFIQDWAARSAELVGSQEPNEEAHLHELCAGLARMAPESFPPRKAIAYESDGLKSGPIHGDPQFLVLQFDLEPGAVIRAHNHVGWNFISMGVRGEATVKHFEPLPGSPAPDQLDVDFRVREVSSTWLARGRTSTLTRTRANIHWFRAGEDGATFLDFGVHFSGPGAGPKIFSAMDFDERPVDPVRGIHEARWLGNIYAKKD